MSLIQFSHYQYSILLANSFATLCMWILKRLQQSSTKTLSLFLGISLWYSWRSNWKRALCGLCSYRTFMQIVSLYCAMTHPAFILIPLVIPFTLSFYLWFIPTVENTAHFLVAQIKLKQLFFTLTLLFLDTCKAGVKIRSLAGPMSIFPPHLGESGFHPKGPHSNFSCLSYLKTNRYQKSKSYFSFNCFLRGMKTPIFSWCGVLPAWLIHIGYYTKWHSVTPCRKTKKYSWLASNHWFVTFLPSHKHQRTCMQVSISLKL